MREDEKSLFTRFWTNESRTTRNVLARIPEGSDYRPDPKSRTAKEIAWQIVCEERMIVEAGTCHMATRPASAPPIYVALLRGVNVGGKNMVSMKALKESFARLDVENVSTYINSGNVLFTANDDGRQLEARIDVMLSREYGLKGKTVVRSSAEMARVVRRMASLWDDDPAWRYNVIFLRHTLDPRRLLREIEIKPDLERVVACQGTLLWAARVDALHRTAMLKLAAKPAYQQVTVRNANTTRKIYELMRRMESAGTDHGRD